MILATIDRQPRLADMTVDDLRRELARGLSLTADTLARLAAVWAELERRGEDLSDLRHGIARFLALIAAGQLAAEAVVAYAGRPGVLQAIVGVPLDRQRELAAGGEVRVYDADQKQTIRTTMDRIPFGVVKQVFAEGVERTPEEQRAARTPPRKPAPAAKRHRVTVNREKRTVRVGQTEVAVDEVLAAFAMAAAEATEINVDLAETEGTGFPMASCFLTEEEAMRLDALARAKKLDKQVLVRQAVIGFLLV